MDNSRFKNKNGTLTGYAFTCGYIEKIDMHGIEATIQHEGCYTLRVYHHAHFPNQSTPSRKIDIWYNSNNITKIRKKIPQIKRIIKKAIERNRSIHFYNGL